MDAPKPPAARAAPGTDPSIQYAGTFWEQGDPRSMTLGDEAKGRAFAILHGYARPMVSRPDMHFPQLEEFARSLAGIWSSYGGDEKRCRVEAIRASKTMTSVTKQEPTPGGA